jgi:hypothetical protein
MRLDFTPVLLAAALAFVVLSALQLTNTLAAGERGLLRFERACPIYSAARSSV